MRKFNGKSNISGSIIEKYRELRNMSREDLAEKLRSKAIEIYKTCAEYALTKGVIIIYRIEQNSVILKDFELIAICEILNIGLDQLKPLLKQK